MKLQEATTPRTKHILVVHHEACFDGRKGTFTNSSIFQTWSNAPLDSIETETPSTQGFLRSSVVTFASNLATRVTLSSFSVTTWISSQQKEHASHF